MYLYKTIGLSVGISDICLSIAASTASILQALTRVLLGYLYDKVGFRKLFFAIMTLQTLNALFCYHARNFTPLFFTCI